MPKGAPVTRKDFVLRWMRECGVTYSQACRIYESMCRSFEEGIVAGSKIRVGRVGAVVPVWRAGRDIHMHFAVGKGKKVKRGIHRTFNMDGRYVFKFNVYDQFIANHQLKWFLEWPEDS